MTDLGEDEARLRVAWTGRDSSRCVPANCSTAELAFRRADGATVWGAVSASVVGSGGTGPYGICLVEDITSRKRVEAELQHMALHDQLTGLANRSLFMDRVEQALATQNAKVASG